MDCVAFCIGEFQEEGEPKREPQKKITVYGVWDGAAWGPLPMEDPMARAISFLA